MRLGPGTGRTFLGPEWIQVLPCVVNTRHVLTALISEATSTSKLYDLLE